MGLSITHNYTKDQLKKMVELDIDITNNSQLHELNHKALDKFLEVNK